MLRERIRESGPLQVLLSLSTEDQVTARGQ